MNPDKNLPRKFLSCWVHHQPPRGRPQQTWAHGFKNDLSMIGFEASSSLWMELAQDEATWTEHWETILKNYGRFTLNPMAAPFVSSSSSSLDSNPDVAEFALPLSYADVIAMPAPIRDADGSWHVLTARQNNIQRAPNGARL